MKASVITELAIVIHRNCGKLITTNMLRIKLWITSVELILSTK